MTPAHDLSSGPICPRTGAACRRPSCFPPASTPSLHAYLPVLIPGQSFVASAVGGHEGLIRVAFRASAVGFAAGWMKEEESWLRRTTRSWFEGDTRRSSPVTWSG